MLNNSAKDLVGIRFKLLVSLVSLDRMEVMSNKVNWYSIFLKRKAEMSV